VKGGGRRAAFATSVVGGRPTHPPVVEKKIKKKIPKKEMRLALRSAVAATASKEIVSSRGHVIDDVPDFPLVVVDAVQELKRTQEVQETLIKLGVWSDVYRVKESVKIRAGKGKMRGRRRKRAIGPLLVVTKDEGIVKAARNVPGVNIITIDSLNAELLAPGTHAGRLTVWTNSAIEQLDKLFGGKWDMDSYDIVYYPLMTESTSRILETQNKLVFIVNMKATKTDIKKAVEELYEVRVSKVNVAITHRGEKKAFVKLDPEYKATDVAIKLGIL
jgi:large subunit ribosomal protein L4e